MDTETLQWSTASSLPHPLGEASTTLCADQVYILGGFDQTGKESKSVFTCSLATLAPPILSATVLESTSGRTAEGGKTTDSYVIR